MSERNERSRPEPSEAAIEAAREASRRPDDIGESFLPRRLVLTVLRAAYAVDAWAGPPPAGDPQVVDDLETVVALANAELRMQDNHDHGHASVADWAAVRRMEAYVASLRAALRGGSHQPEEGGGITASQSAAARAAILSPNTKLSAEANKDLFRGASPQEPGKPQPEPDATGDPTDPTDDAIARSYEPGGHSWEKP